MQDRLAYLATFAFLSATVFAMAALSLAPVPGNARQVAVFAPGWSADRSFAAAVAADVDIIAPGKFANIVLVSAPEASARQALYAHGAWIVVDAARLAACFSVFK